MSGSNDTASRGFFHDHRPHDHIYPVSGCPSPETLLDACGNRRFVFSRPVTLGPDARGSETTPSPSDGRLPRNRARPGVRKHRRFFKTHGFRGRSDRHSVVRISSETYIKTPDYTECALFSRHSRDLRRNVNDRFTRPRHRSPEPRRRSAFRLVIFHDVKLFSFKSPE